MKDLESLDAIETYLDVQEEDLNIFYGRNSISEHPSAHRAFKFGLKFVFMRCEIKEDDNRIHIEKMVDSHDFIRMYKSNLPLFLAFDMAGVEQNWVLMDMKENQVYLLLRSTDQKKLKASVGALRTAREMAYERAEWDGLLFYKIIDGGGQNEIK